MTIADAPAYQLAWATGMYTMTMLGTTTAGTQVAVWTLPGDETAAAMGTAHLKDVFDWYEKTYGAYTFGSLVGSVDVVWGPGQYGGMEHHPMWHIANIAMGDELTHAHEAAHGWFGDGIRIKCWEDFVLSEGSADYLSARALGAVEGQAAEDAVWAGYAPILNGSAANGVAWPDGCGVIDPLANFSEVPYEKGSHFLKALETRVGRAMLDTALAQFHSTWHGKAAGMQDLLDTVMTVTGYDATACAQMWLKSPTLPPTAMQASCP
jgi:aminopeptidase N